MQESIDPRQVKSKKKIYEALLKLLTRTKKTVSVKEVCEEASVTRPTFYKYYNDVNSLMNSMTEEVLQDLKDSLIIKKKILIEEVKFNELPINMIALFNHIQKNHIFYEIFLLIKHDPHFVNEVKTILEEFISIGLHYSTPSEEKLVLPVSILISYVTGAYLESIIWWIKNNYKYSPEEMTSMLLRISIKGPYTDEMGRFERE
ncbi:TetR/AcrR family transcriptional regulator [Psychrobacillus antarcticus]|uniref:TetR/AcrR family transcriptional regulator n=1 Tax=Psychrobacillus antarcticus TaxID=2879115 RepID=UPI0024079236|nr:TetR-like C-terminal domain-containing protein [Psychrobacillus antarcticus]